MTQGVFNLFTFLSTLSLRRATINRAIDIIKSRHFYPRSPCGERPSKLKPPVKTHRHFYPRSPCGERRKKNEKKCEACRISIHALLAESDCFVCSLRNGQLISIHALLAESDVSTFPCFHTVYISIHALLAESDDRAGSNKATHGISIHALLAESDGCTVKQPRPTTISIHALLAESDHKPNGSRCTSPQFLSTLSLRRATH